MLKKMLFILTALFAMHIGFAVAEEVAPDDLVRKSINEIMSAIKADKDMQAGDARKIEKLAEEKVLPYFDFAHMTQLAVGRNWKDANDTQKTSLTREFRALLVNTYSSSLAQFRNQTIDVKALKIAPTESDVVVKTLVSQASGKPVPLDYSMEKAKDGWKVYDVLIDGVSLVTNYRSSFNKEIQTSGIDGLIKSIQDRNAKNAGKK